MTNLYLIVFLIIFIILCAFISSVLIKDNTRKKEGFAATDALELKILQACGRNLVFPYFGANTINTASQRALMDSSIATFPAGQCAINDANGEYNDSMAMVHEDSIFYALKKACIGLEYSRYKFEMNNTRLVVDFNTDSNLYKFLLLNPLFVEFNFKLGQETIVSLAYIPNIYDDPTKNSSKNEKSLNIGNFSYKKPTIRIAFDIAVHPTQGGCDAGFNYSKLSSKQKPITVQQMASVFKGGKIINLTVFYLGDLGLNFQKTGRTLPVTQATQRDASSMIMFDEKYAEMSKDQYRSVAYAFMQTFATFYYNFITPVLTFSFDIVVGTDKKVQLNGSPSQLFKAFMKNGYNGGGDLCANNIVSVGMTGDSSKLRLQVGIGNKKECGMVKGKEDWGSPALYLDLPYLTPNTTISMTLTIGPNQKHLYAEWYDIDGGDQGKKFAYAKTVNNVAEPPYNVCRPFKTTEDTNNFTRMFSSRTLNPRPELKTTILEWDNKYVTKVRGVTLGYVNFNDINSSSR